MAANHAQIYTQTPKKQSADMLELCVFDDLTRIESPWRELEKLGFATLYQRLDWFSRWLNTIGRDVGVAPKLVLGLSENRPQFILPLSERRLGPVRLIEWLADSHSNFQAGLYSNDFLENITAEGMTKIMSDTANLLDKPDLFSLRCQPETLFGYKNPMAAVDGYLSPNPAFALDMRGGFEATLDRINGGKRKKKYRWQIRQIGDETKVRLKTATNESEVNEILRTAFDQMAIRFDKSGITNVFDNTAAKTFFQNLAEGSLHSDQSVLRLYALEIDGQIRATLAGGMNGNHFSACFISLAEDELAYLSPGQLLIYKVIEDLADRGVQSFDFGRGNEPYKRSWTDQEVTMIDVTLAFSKLGQSLAALERGKAGAKRLVRNNEKLWSLAKQMRSALRKTG